MLRIKNLQEARPRQAILLAILFLAGLVGCTGGQDAGQNSDANSQSAAASAPAAAESEAAAASDQNAASLKLKMILAAQPEAVQARFKYRHPQETLDFFGIEPGMVVAEALPGGGWYSKILIEQLGPDGALIGANYPTELWPNFAFADAAYLARMATWVTDWPNTAEGWRSDNSAPISAFVFGELPEANHNSADAVVFIRALHNLARFDHSFLNTALTDAYALLKPGGIAGVVQHEARPDMPDEWANGAAGYLKKDFVIAQMQAVGFEYLGESEVNANPADIPTTDDIVWRLPPSLATSKDNAELAETLKAVGESNRMTLKFVKPEA